MREAEDDRLRSTAWVLVAAAGARLQTDRAVLDLSETLLAEAILDWHGQGWTGIVDLTQGDVAKEIHFEDGEVVHAASSLEADRLGACLFRSGLISEEQFHAAMQAAGEGGLHLGRAMVESGVLTPAQLAAARAGQVERIVLSVLRWTGGQARRRPPGDAVRPELGLDLQTHRVLLLGGRQYPNVARLERALSDRAGRLRRASASSFDYDLLPPSPAERAVLALCTRPRSLQELLNLPHPPSEVVRAVFALLVGALLEEEPVAVEAATWAGLEAESSGFEPAGPGAGPVGPEAVTTPEEAERAAQQWLEKGFRSKALEILQGVLANDPRARGARRLLAMTLAHEGGFRSDVESHFLEALSADPTDTELRYALATYYRKAGMISRALQQLRLVLSADPSHAAALRDLGVLETQPPRRER